MKRRLSYRDRLILLIVCITLIAVVLTIGPTIFYMDRYINDTELNRVLTAKNQIVGMIEFYQGQSRTAAVLLSSERDMIDAVEHNDSEEILRFAGPLAKKAGVEFATITDSRGDVLARTHEPEKNGDSVLNQFNVQRALVGEVFSGVEKGSAVKLSARSGAPVMNNQGKVIGVVSAGFRIDRNDFADQLKENNGIDSAYFLGNELVATSIFQNGHRLDKAQLGQAVADKVMAGQTLNGAYELAQTMYTASLVPIVGPDKKPIGIIFIGIPMAEKNAVRSHVFRIVFGITIIVLCIGFGLTMVVARQLTRPIQHMSEGLERLAGGNLSQLLMVTTDDEIGALGRGINHMTEQLRGLASTVMELTESLAASASQLSTSASECTEATRSVANDVADVAHQTDTQLRAVQRIQSAVSRVLTSTEQMAGNAGTVNGITTDASKITRDGQALVDRAVIQMTRISNSAERAHNAVDVLAVSSKEIGNIVRLISEIADQTNLLALNAAIEAARAGEQGRGFAVVADEVRKLAEESGKAAHQISELIHANQGSSEEAVNAMIASIQDVKEGIDAVNMSGSLFKNIADNIENVSQEVRNITILSDQVLTESRAVSDAIEKVETVCQTTVNHTESVTAASQEQLAAMEEIAATSEQLSGRALALRGAVGRFTV